MSRSAPTSMESAKHAVLEHWEQAACGEELYLRGATAEGYREQARRRYELEPYIEQFADFEAARGRHVLEVGVGLGADHERFAAAGANLSGIDLSRRAVEHARRRLGLFGLDSGLLVGDAERLPFASCAFDLVYSWGVIHHSPDTAAAVAEIHRVLRPGGMAKIMIYHRSSLVGYMLWLRYALARGRPWTSLDRLYADYLESPGTKAYSRAQARALFAVFARVQIETRLTHADLLESQAGQRHEGALIRIARKVWPRALLRRFAPGHGLFMLITAVK
jgi:SAM-dependent methyltransferase